MRMDENSNPEWEQLLRGTSSGRKALEIISSLESQLSAVPELVEALNWISTSLNDSDVMREIAKAALAKYKGENTDET